MTKFRMPRKSKKKIPKNTFYCYTPLTGMIYEEGKLPYYKIKRCPFYNYVNGLEGYCKLLKCEIIDQVKECGVRYGKSYYKPIEDLNR